MEDARRSSDPRLPDREGASRRRAQAESAEGRRSSDAMGEERVGVTEVCASVCVRARV